MESWSLSTFANASSGNLDPSTCNTITSFVINAELVGAMTAVKIAPRKGCFHICMKSDSMLVSLPFESLEIVF